MTDLTPVLIGLCLAGIIAAGTAIACMAVGSWYRAWRKRHGPWWIIALALVVLGTSAHALTGWDYSRHTYVSTARDGVYIWSVRNESYAHSLVGWTVGGESFETLPGSWLLEESLPLPLVEAGIPHGWYQVAYRSAAEPVTVDSVLRWSDGYEATVPVLYPSVPEPCGLLTLGLGLAGLLKCALYKRT
jgi:hypothetical protein